MIEIRRSIETKFLTCRYCNEPYKKPKVLECLHSFCQVCLEDLLIRRKAKDEARAVEPVKTTYQTTALDQVSSYRRKWSSRFRQTDPSPSRASSRHYRSSVRQEIITCPICNKDNILPLGGVDSLPADQLTDKLASMIDRMPTYPVCDVCTTEPFILDGAKTSHTVDMEDNAAFLNTKKNSLYDNMEPKKGLPNRGKFNTTLDYSEVDEDEGVSLDKSNSHSTTNANFYYHSTSQLAMTNKHVIDDHKTKTNSIFISQTSPRQANTACLDCAKRLCDTCCEAHGHMPVTAGHVLIHVNQMDELRCQKHPRELKQFFCVTCRTYICIICAFETNSNSPDSKSTNDQPPTNETGHANHEVLSLREAVATYQDQLCSKSSETQMHMDKIEWLHNGLIVCQAEISHIRDSIEQTAAYFTNLIDQQRLRLYEQLDSIVGVGLDQVDAECQQLTTAVKSWYEFLNDDKITSRLDLINPIEALTESGPMLDRLQRCLELATSPLLYCPEWQPLLLLLNAADKSVSQARTKTNCIVDGGKDGRTNYWQACLGQFEQGLVNLGRLVTPNQRALEAKAIASKFMSTHVQTGPELIKTLPPPKGTLLHRAVQVEMVETKLIDKSVQTEAVYQPFVIRLKADCGTQYQSSDVNPPVSIYRSIKQILVQK